MNTTEQAHIRKALSILSGSVGQDEVDNACQELYAALEIYTIQQPVSIYDLEDKFTSEVLDNVRAWAGHIRELVDHCSSQLPAIRSVRHLTGLGLPEAKKLAEARNIYIELLSLDPNIVNHFPHYDPYDL